MWRNNICWTTISGRCDKKEKINAFLLLAGFGYASHPANLFTRLRFSTYMSMNDLTCKIKNTVLRARR